MAAIVCATLIIAAIYMVLFSRSFTIEYLHVEAKGIDESVVRSVLFEYMDDSHTLFRRNNIVIFNPDEASKLLGDRFQIERLEMKKRYPSTIEISIDAKPFRLLAYGGGAFYDITTRGTIAREIDPDSIEFYPSFILSYEQRGRASLVKPLTKEVPAVPLIYLGNTSLSADQSSPLLPSNSIDQVREMKTLMDATKMKAIFFRINGNEPEYAVMTKYGWEARFTTLTTPRDQFERLQTLFNEKLYSKKRGIDYVDLRFGNKAYYRFQ